MQSLILQLRLAFGFLTLLPVTPKKLAALEDFSKATKFFSLVGIFLGGLYTALIYFGSSLDSDVLAIFYILINLFVTGGLHHDGFMDTMDGVAASRTTRAETLEVMKDSRAGAFAAMAIAIVFLVQFVFFQKIDFDGYHSNLLLVELLVMPAISRIIMLAVVYYQADTTDQNSSIKMFTENKKPILYLVINILIMKLAAVLMINFQGWGQFWANFSDYLYFDALWFAWMLSSWFIYAYLKYKLKGHNGDSLGAGLLLSETLFLILLGLFY